MFRPSPRLPKIVRDRASKDVRHRLSAPRLGRGALRCDEKRAHLAWTTGERGLGAEGAGGLALEAENKPKVYIARADECRHARPQRSPSSSCYSRS